jgi:hypothetical protein
LCAPFGCGYSGRYSGETRLSVAADSAAFGNEVADRLLGALDTDRERLLAAVACSQTREGTACGPFSAQRRTM